MLFTITREQLLKPLQQVCGVLASRPTLPIINNILLEVEGDVDRTEDFREEEEDFFLGELPAEAA